MSSVLSPKKDIQRPPPIPDDEKKLSHWLIERFSLRGHMAVIFSCIFAAGFTVDGLLRYWGMASILWRYSVSIIFAYGVFFALVRIWLKTIVPYLKGDPAAPSTNWFWHRNLSN